MACGLARRGALPIVHSFACFLSARPNEQIYNQCSEGSKVIYVGSLAGLLPGGPGHSHQSVRDISALGSVPNLLMAEPAVADEVHALFDYLVSTAAESSYLRLVSVKWPVPFAYPAGQRCSQVRAGSCARGSDLVVFGYGPWLLSNAWHAAEELQQKRRPHDAARQPPVAQSRRSGLARGRRSATTARSCCWTTTTCTAGRVTCWLRRLPRSGWSRRQALHASASRSCRSAGPTTKCSRITASTSRRS